jgi:sugar phosphate permease
VPAIINGFWAVVNFVSVPSRPEDAGLDKTGTRIDSLTESSSSSLSSNAKSKSDDSAVEPIGFIQAFMLPNVLNYAIAFGFFKLVNYAMFFQLPIILSSHFDPSTANIISSLYSVGMMPGGIVCGWISDLFGGRRACVIAIFMGCLCPLLYIFAMHMDSLPIILTLFLLALMGCLVGGPNNIITSAVAADLADDPSIRGNNRALGTVTGIINGSGSVTAAFGQLAIPILYSKGLEAQVGYRYVWFFLIMCTVVGTSLMSPKIRKELNSISADEPDNSSSSGNGQIATETTPLVHKK